jgi:hypothetical protein
MRRLPGGDTLRHPRPRVQRHRRGRLLDPNANHASVHSCGALPNDAGCLAGTHRARIGYTPGTLSLFVDDLLAPLLPANVDLATTLALLGAGLVGGGAVARRRVSARG